MTPMALFTSNRERRLWYTSLVVILAIYSTLGITGKLAGLLRERNLLNTAYILGLLLVGAAIVGSGLKRRASSPEVWVALGLTAVYGLLMVRLFIRPEERTHLIEYSIVAALIYHALVERKGNGRRVSQPAVLAIVATAILGFFDEGIQALLPNRVYDIRDVGFNALAGLMAVLTIFALSWVRRLSKRN